MLCRTLIYLRILLLSLPPLARSAGLRPLFTLPAAQYGGAAKFAWNSDGSYLFTVGSNGECLLAELAPLFTR